MNHKADALEQLRLLRMDLTNAQAKLTNAMTIIARLPDPPDTQPHRCPHCGIHKPGPNALAEHIDNIHYDLRP